MVLCSALNKLMVSSILLAVLLLVLIFVFSRSKFLIKQKKFIKVAPIVNNVIVIFAILVNIFAIRLCVVAYNYKDYSATYYMSYSDDDNSINIDNVVSNDLRNCNKAKFRESVEQCIEERKLRKEYNYYDSIEVDTYYKVNSMSDVFNTLFFNKPIDGIAEVEYTRNSTFGLYEGKLRYTDIKGVETYYINDYQFAPCDEFRNLKLGNDVGAFVVSDVNEMADIKDMRYHVVKVTDYTERRKELNLDG